MGCEAGDGPVDGEGDQVGDELLGAGRKAGLEKCQSKRNQWLRLSKA